MKKLVCLCLFLCLLGCQSKPKEEPLSYQYTIEEQVLGNSFMESIVTYVDTQHLLFKSHHVVEEDLLYSFQDTTTGMTKAIYRYDLKERQATLIKATEEGMKISDFAYLENYLIYSVVDDNQHFEIWAEDKSGKQTLLDEGESTGAQLVFDVTDDTIGYLKKEILEVGLTDTVSYQVIDENLMVKNLWQQNYAPDNKFIVQTYEEDVLVYDGTIAYYLHDGIIEQVEGNENLILMEDYILIDNSHYYDLETKKVLMIDNGTLDYENKLIGRLKNSIVYFDFNYDLILKELSHNKVSTKNFGESIYCTQMYLMEDSLVYCGYSKAEFKLSILKATDKN